MSIVLKQFGRDIALSAKNSGLYIESTVSIDWNCPETWPSDAREQSAGRRTSFEIASLLEMGLAEIDNNAVVMRYHNFPEIELEEFRITTAFAAPSPFLLKIDRSSDLGRPDFRYKYKYILGAEQVSLTRFGFYVFRAATGDVYRLDEKMFALLEAMDTFNALPPEEKRPQRTWQDFSNIKRWAKEVNATLDAALLKNDVLIPSSIGLDLYEDEDGALSFVPTCPELEDKSFRTVFNRNSSVEGFYSLDRPGMGKLRIVLTERHQRVLERMKRVRRVTGDGKEALRRTLSLVVDQLLISVLIDAGDDKLEIVLD